MDDESLVDIDDTQLDREWLRQPKLMLEYGEKLAKARLAYNEAKSHVDVVYADLSLTIRQSPGEYNLEKVTEAMVEAAIHLQKEHKEAVKQMHLKKYKMDMLEAAVTALEHRKKALEGRVSLLGMEFYSEPREKGGPKAREAMAQRMVKRAFKPLKNRGN